MSNNKKLFLEKSKNKTQDKVHKGKIAFNINKYNTAVIKGKEQYENITIAREKAKNIKYHTLENLANYLEEFEKNATKNGTEVLYASDAEQAIEAILEICKSVDAKMVVKSKSMVTEEIHLNHHLEKNGIESIETDLGEYIQQLDGEPPYHIVTPAMHKSKEDIAKLFHEKLGVAEHLAPYELTLVARDVLREKYTQADIGITGGNFLIADIGAVAVTENEGNARLTTAFPKIHIAIVGIEKLIPSIQNLSLFWPLLATFGTGQKITVYNTLLLGPKKQAEENGPEKMFVILLDNGRTKVYKDPHVRESLYCIRCGSCLNACPVYKNIGGHAYSTTYSGPIGSVLSPYLQGYNDYKHLSHASSLCGNCTEVCPLKINIHNMLHYNRTKAVEDGMYDKIELFSWKAWSKAMLHRSSMDIAPPAIKNFMVNTIFQNLWTKDRAELNFQKSFGKQWKDKNKSKT